MPVGSNRDRGHGERDRDRDKKDAKSSVNPNRPMQPADMDLTDMERYLTYVVFVECSCNTMSTISTAS